MSDNKNITHPQDAKRIDVNDPAEIRNWCASFNCSEAELKAAVKAVGTWAVDVKKHLGK
jgi:hypothetical protein